ncbi:MAG: DUF1176 domain-containing protein [Bacteriovorax sp.]|jgi:hypothetical protein
MFILFFCLSYFTLVRADDASFDIPAKLLARHTAICPEFNTERGKYYMKGEYALPKSKYSKETKTLYILGCEMYAYNSLEKAYILDAKDNITDVYVAVIDHIRSITATADLMGAGYDEETFMLYTFQKGRGIGDCGSASTYLYNPEEEKFILMEARLKNNCDGDIEADWPVIYSK